MTGAAAVGQPEAHLLRFALSESARTENRCRLSELIHSSPCMAHLGLSHYLEESADTCVGVVSIRGGWEPRSPCTFR